MANFSSFGKRQKELARKEKQQAKAAKRAERKQARESGQGPGDLIEAKERGVVKWFDGTKGFGFIQRENGPDVFVHISSFLDRDLPETLEGVGVEFSVEDGPKGPQASEVYLLSV